MKKKKRCPLPSLVLSQPLVMHGLWPGGAQIKMYFFRGCAFNGLYTEIDAGGLGANDSHLAKIWQLMTFLLGRGTLDKIHQYFRRRVSKIYQWQTTSIKETVHLCKVQWRYQFCSKIFILYMKRFQITKQKNIEIPKKLPDNPKKMPDNPQIGGWQNQKYLLPGFFCESLK